MMFQYTALFETGNCMLQICAEWLNIRLCVARCELIRLVVLRVKT
jgi:hypothetical protein